ncbi:hypothetical protein ACFL27_11105 [candidate division CSSED10-310 bacterium]|uniref:Uncharacterized protein n=1 Tax=candidate division CSSED10-310 bacterium TaxID=2855610 RepID=A0ABV6YX03_UNCC1
MNQQQIVTGRIHLLLKVAFLWLITFFPAGVWIITASEVSTPADSVPAMPPRSSDETTTQMMNPSQWLTEKWWLVEDRYNLYLQNIRLIRDKFILDSMLGKQDQLAIRTIYDLKIFSNDLNFLHHQVMFRYYPQQSLSHNDIDTIYIDPYTSYPFTLNLDDQQTSRLVELIFQMAHDDLDAESQINIGAYFISWANNFETDWQSVRDAVVSAEWVIALGLGAIQYSQNQVALGLVVPVYKSRNTRWAGLLNFHKFGAAMSPQLDVGFIYENRYIAVTSLLRNRYGQGEIYNFIKETIKVTLNADLFSRSFMEDYLKIRWQNTVETRIVSATAPPSENNSVSGTNWELEKNGPSPFNMLHEYSLRLAYYKNVTKSTRDYEIKARYLDLRINSTSVIIPAIIFEKNDGIWPITSEPLTIKMFFSGGYGLPFSLEPTTNLKSGYYFLIGTQVNY